MSYQSGFGASSLFFLIGVAWFYRRNRVTGKPKRYSSELMMNFNSTPWTLSAATQLKRGERAWLNTV